MTSEKETRRFAKRAMSRTDCGRRESDPRSRENRSAQTFESQRDGNSSQLGEARKAESLPSGILTARRKKRVPRRLFVKCRELISLKIRISRLSEYLIR
ncbi:hypothetical protein CDAR_253621 [Caerostris darwini]|uniref:Uncharacterized protein n=1 Tax=Caerostris darwini TaxID=1538125 RepID=A0AAV4Q543_9ARAC|nr:hypothetical protein CDAR_253621 [Caerostris darwini]